MIAKDAVAVSAPGKVLLAGGYLVLDPAYTGLVFGLDARIHVIAQDVPTRHGVTLQEITVTSPQFEAAVWQYGYRMAERDGGVDVIQLRADADLKLDRNVFLETALAYTLSYVTNSERPHLKPAHITILADNDYYSTPSNAKQQNASDPSSRFYDFAVPLAKASKTGLGSSAALVTAFTAALLRYYLPKSAFDLENQADRKRLHNLAQAAHCAAQGKVGSGFDVASAVFGSCLYRRFSPSILTDRPEAGAKNFAMHLKALVDDSATAEGSAIWDTEIIKDQVMIPQGLRLVMCDVKCGSQTPGMVKTVLSWRKDKPEEAAVIWNSLHEANNDLVKAMKLASERKDRDYKDITTCFGRIRSDMRLMSEKSGVPIEPLAQTNLLDACEGIKGVIGGVVPGAGGYDAISLLIEDVPHVRAELERVLAEWSSDHHGSGSAIESGSAVSVLGVREEFTGVKSEDPQAYNSWVP